MLTFQDDIIHQQLEGFEKSWTIFELLETYNPLPGEPLSDRNDAMRQILNAAEERFRELSPTALLRYDFWKNLQPQRITKHCYEYTTQVTDTYQWEFVLQAEGLFYKDISGEYGPAGKVYEQLFSDYWFYGPLMPLPDLHTRKWVIAHIRNAFLQAGSPSSYQHFDLFEYPKLNDQLYWETGDASVQDFLVLRAHGIEYGRTNWRDGLVFVDYLSFERFLTQPSAGEAYLTADIRSTIEQYLAPKASPKLGKSATSAADTSAISKRLFMENGGQKHYIYLDGFGDIYDATPAQEAAWRKELLEKNAKKKKN